MSFVDSGETSNPNYRPKSLSRVGEKGVPIIPPEGTENPIELLPPGSELHTRVLDYLLTRLRASERKMGDFHNRWRVNERRFQAYINTQDFEKLLENSNKKGETPSAVSITVPYAYATVWTIVTYLVHTFCGRKPIFQCGSYRAEDVEPARKMETMLQFNADKDRLVNTIFQWMIDGQIYGLGVTRTLWTTEYRKRNRYVSGAPLGVAAPNLLPDTQMLQEESYLCYEGNQVRNIDPYHFFPDPRVPMEEVNRRGEFVFWRTYEGLHSLKKAEAQNLLMFIEAIGKPSGGKGEDEAESNRNLRTDGSAHPGRVQENTEVDHFHQIDQGTVEIIPSELGLGDSDEVEKWIFSIANKRQIIQAEPFDNYHGRHPVSVIEPNSVGYGFGQVGVVDMLGPIQDVLSWFVNSHMFNVRSALNNKFIVDPAFVEMQDLKNPGPGTFIRLKASAMGRDVRTMLQQLQVQDVTSSHINDMQNFMRLGDILSATNDNLRGVQEAGGRKTATEVRTAGESGASRLASLARRVSAQGMVDLAEQMSCNIQQYQSMEFYLKIVGMEGAMTPINPGDLQGELYFPVHDGTLPLDRIALLDVWKEIWLAVATNQQLSMTYNGPAIFEYVADLGGARNLSQFRIQVAQPGIEMPNQGVTPVNGALPGTRGNGNGAAAPAPTPEGAF